MPASTDGPAFRYGLKPVARVIYSTVLEYNKGAVRSGQREAGQCSHGGLGITIRHDGAKGQVGCISQDGV